MSTALPGADFVGRLIDGRFTLLRWLGETESSSVFLTEFGDEPKRKAAIKFIAADRADAQASIRQWEIAKNLSHPQLVELFDHGRVELDGKDMLFAVTEYAEEVLSEILPERPLTPAETREMLGPVLDALTFLHGRDLVHGHLIPSNIMVVDDRLKLSSDRLLVAGEPLRRPRSSWDAPETAAEKIAPAADVWSLGVVLVEALTQKFPAWERGQGGEPEVPVSIPEPFFGIARECLRIDPARRLTLDGVKAQLEPAEPAEPVAVGGGKPLSDAVAMVVIGALLGVGAVVVAHRISHRETTPSPADSSQSSSQASLASRPQSPTPGGETPRGPVVKGEVASRVLPEVPEKVEGAIRGHIRVVIRVRVDAQGKIVQASIDNPGPSRYFANQALNAAEKWKFTPAWVGGETAASVWALEFHFASTGIDASAKEESP
jgi:TonB family protein